MRRSKVNSITELKAEQQKLKIQSEVSKQLFFESLNLTRTSATDFAVNKVILPAGAAGAALWGAKKVFGNNNHDEEAQPSGNHSGVLASIITKLLPLGISMVNAYFTKQVAKETGAV